MGPNACRATNGTVNICREGYTGPECAVCSPDYFFSWTSHECKMCAASNDAEVTITIAMPIVFGALCLILMAAFVYRGFPSRRADTGGEGNGAHQPSSETAPGGGQSGTSGSGSSATVHPVSGGSKDSDASENDQQLTANKEGSADSNSAMEQDVKDPPPKKQYGKRAKPASEIEAPTSASTALETAGTGQRVVGGIGGSVVALLKLLLNLVQVLNAIAPTYGKDRFLCNESLVSTN